MRINNSKGESQIVPCGKCNFCLQNRRNAWAFRLTYELKRAKTASFITLTYDNEHVPVKIIGTRPYLVLDKSELQSFHKVLKQYQSRLLRKLKIKDRKEWKIKYYSCGEYGTTYNRPHYHCIIYNLHPKVKEKLAVNEIWKKGTIFFGTVEEASIQYVAKYVIDKEQAEDLRTKPFANMSKGLGSNYIDKRKTYHQSTRTFYVTKEGFKQSMPRYYKERIFTKNQLKRLAMLAKHEAEKAEDKDIKRIQHEANCSLQQAWKTYEDRITRAYDQIRIKSKQSNSNFL
jgi:hypothetical protein